MSISAWLNWSCCLVPFVIVARHSKGLMFFLNVLFNTFMLEFILIVANIPYSNQTSVGTLTSFTPRRYCCLIQDEYCILCLTVAADDDGLLWLARVLDHVEIKGRLLWLLFSPHTTLILIIIRGGLDFLKMCVPINGLQLCKTIGVWHAISV